MSPVQKVTKCPTWMKSSLKVNASSSLSPAVGSVKVCSLSQPSKTFIVGLICFGNKCLERFEPGFSDFEQKLITQSHVRTVSYIKGNTFVVQKKKTRSHLCPCTATNVY